MKKVAFAAVLAGAATLMACGGDDDINILDSGPIADGPPARCNPVTQDGCEEGEKCAQLTIELGEDVLARTDCVPDGPVAIGGECVDGEPGETTGFDNCAAGGQCFNELCHEICSGSPETCTEGTACGFPVDFFEDIEPSQTGVCFEECNPVAQDCAIEGEGCYLSIGSEGGEGTCVAAPIDADGLRQNDDCLINDEFCFLNGCDIGFAPYPPLVLVPDEVAVTCTAYCQPVDTYLNDPDGDGEPDGDGTPESPDVFGNPVGFDDEDPKTPAIDCSAGRLEEAAPHQCRFFQSIGNGMNGRLGQIPPEYGFCVELSDTTRELWGDCALTSYERQFKAFDEGFPTPDTIGDDGRTAYCDEFPNTCAALCTSIEQFDAIGDVYCKANEDSPICQPATMPGRGPRRGATPKMWDIYHGRTRSTLRAATSRE
jgi:hypothetical protein